MEINGKIKIIDGTQAAGRVLTTNVTGLASWQSFPAALPSVAIYGKTFSGSLSVPSGSPTRIVGWANIEQAGGNNYNLATGIYTIPIAGFYQVTGSILWDPILTNCNTNLALNVNNTVVCQNYQPSSNLYGVWCSISCGRRFTAGDILTFDVLQTFGFTVSLYGPYSGQSFSIAYIHP